ncbi:MAG: RtcB family protein, partial [Flavobacteriales bacterium]|nr:RtcB family protein [Flavobacteriales bacterium]
MGNSKLRSKDLLKIKQLTNEEISLALGIMAKHFKYESKAKKLEVLTNVLSNPKKFIEDEHPGQLANCFIETKVKSTFIAPALNEKPKPYQIFGKKLIDQAAIRQMDTAMQLPIAAAGALMPDAHVGYGLPIGGVLATKNEIIPYAVGMDIGCRMCLTVYPENDRFINQYRHQVKVAIKEHTHFGITKRTHLPTDHEVLNRVEFNEILPLKELLRKAAQQLGTSGSGNHFVEAGTVELPEGNQWNIKAGKYFGLLSHSGS